MNTHQDRAYRSRRASRAALVALVALPAACAGTLERATRADLARRVAAGDAPAPTGWSLGGAPQKPGPAEPLLLSGELPYFLAYAAERHPELRAGFEQWRAAVLRIAPARKLPEPRLTYGYFIRGVETRVGPQQHRFGIAQMFPWPRKLDAAAEAAAARARAAQRRFEAALLSVSRVIADAYWRLWFIDTAAARHSEQLALLESLAESIRARLETGGATLADVAQLDVTVSRLCDQISGLEEARRSAAAALVAAIGAPPLTQVAATAEAPPGDGTPALAESDMLASTLDHPRIAAIDLVARSHEAQARVAANSRWPSIGLGADYIVTGEAGMPDVEDSGKDPLVALVFLDLPIWWGAYAAEREAALADSLATRAEAAAARDQAAAALQAALAELRDARRRIGLYRDTIIPQARTAYESVAGGLAAGRASFAALLLAQRDLLDLTVALARAQADYATAWARLEDVVGRDVEWAHELRKEDEHD